MWSGMDSPEVNGDLSDPDSEADQSASQKPPIVNIVGVQVALGPLRRELLPDYTRWRNDFAVARTLDYIPGPFTTEERETWFTQASLDTATTRFTVYERAN